MLRIGLTGGIACGKTTVAKLFESLGTTIIDADILAREMVISGTPCFSAILKRFGDQILNEKGEINRQALRHIIFEKENERAWLEQLLHPTIRELIQKRVKEVTSLYCVLVIPLLLEKNIQEDVDRILVVDAPQSLQIERLKQRNQLSDVQIEAILKTQVSREKRLRAAKDIIHNDSDLNHLEQQVIKLHTRYQTLASLR